MTAVPPIATELMRCSDSTKGAIRRPEQVQQSARTKLPYSITSSAVICMIKGIVTPSALAVLRLMTSSNLVGA